MTTNATSRREFLRRTAGTAITAGGIGYWSQSTAAQSTSPSEKMRLGAIGVGNRGGVNLFHLESEQFVALCDIDEKMLGQAAERHPKAELYHDFRELLDRTDLDGLLISSPNHTHFHPAYQAINQGLHVYCEKPLTHNIKEARQLAKAAQHSNVVAQTGNQHHSSNGYRRAMAIIRSGILGEIHEVHSWTNRPIWPQGIERPTERPDIPAHVHWDLWLGPAPQRPYHGDYLPRRWRGWWDFGGGALADMGPHLIDPAYSALKLNLPESVEAESSPVNDETAPLWSIVRFLFPARGKLPPVKLVWYDGDRKPAQEIAGGARLPANGTLLLGKQGKMFIPELGKQPILLAGDDGEKPQPPKISLPPSPGHQQEWVRACKQGQKVSSGFDYGARLTETCLLGNVAIRLGERIVWNGPQMEATNCPAADQYLSREYRRGWEI